MTPPPIVIREAGPDDAAGVVAVLNPIIAAGVFTTLTAELSEEDERRYIESFPARGLFLVAVADDTLVGLQSVEPFDAFTPAFDHVGVVGTFCRPRLAPPGRSGPPLCGDSCRGAGQRLREALHLHPRRQRGRPGRVRATRLRDDRHGTAARPHRRTIRRRSHGRALPRPRLGRTPRRCLAPPSSRRRAAVKEPPAAGGLSGRRVAAATRRPR